MPPRGSNASSSHSVNASMRKPAPTAAVTISPSPWAYSTDVFAVVSASGAAYEPEALEALWLCPEVREVELQRVDASDHLRGRMEVDQHEPPPAAQRRGRGAHPRVDVGDPTQHAVRGEDQVEATLELARQVLGVGLHEGGVEAGLGGEPASPLYRHR